MHITVELDVDEISILAYLAKILNLSKRRDLKKMKGVYPLTIVMAMNDLIEKNDGLLEDMDLPFEIGDDFTKHTTILEHQTQQISEELFEMKAKFQAKRADK
ncbi:MAG: hypothetical protein HN855_07545 [Anaerolineae bacterium]|nr:hypothetical protein [Anaerolineae bacterium]MBT7071959.1 hypothetical protein [Anaerolineae bacterium]MBT7324993.1 hypothetical protein [Anaerolineae bacterium]